MFRKLSTWSATCKLFGFFKKTDMNDTKIDTFAAITTWNRCCLSNKDSRTTRKKYTTENERSECFENIDR